MTESKVVIRKFQAFDKNGDGLIDPVELSQVLKRLDATVWTDAKLAKLFRVLDTNSDGMIEISEFVEWAFASPGVLTRDLHAFRVAVNRAKTTSRGSRAHSRAGTHDIDSTPSERNSSPHKSHADGQQEPSALAQTTGSTPVTDPASAPDEKSAENSQIEVIVSLLSGQSTSVVLPQDAFLQDLRVAIEREFAVPARQQKLVLGEVPLPPAASLQEAHIDASSKITVIQISAPPLPTLPQKFALVMTSSICRITPGGRHPADVIQQYEIQVDLESSCVTSSMLRRDDGDDIIINGQQGRIHGESCRWHSGPTKIERSCSQFDLAELLRAWMERSQPVLEVEQCLWSESGTDVNGKFKMPSPDCAELHVDIPLNFWPSCRSLRLFRVLVTSSGWPIRVAMLDLERTGLMGRRNAALPDVQELRETAALWEFDVTVKFPETSEAEAQNEEEAHND